jgi:hypothetical protein
MTLPSELSEAQFAREFACAWNVLDPERIIAHLAEDAVYESQNVLEPLRGREAIADYLRGKMATIRAHPGATVRAELGYVGDQFGRRVSLGFPGQMTGRPCVLVAQGASDKPEALVLLEIGGGQIRRIDLCSVVPEPSRATRTGVYPGLSDAEQNAEGHAP